MYHVSLSEYLSLLVSRTVPLASVNSDPYHVTYHPAGHGCSLKILEPPRCWLPPSAREKERIFVEALEQVAQGIPSQLLVGGLCSIIFIGVKDSTARAFFPMELSANSYVYMTFSAPN